MSQPIPPPPPPTLSPHVARLTTNKSTTPQPKTPAGSLTVGIETELLLESRHPPPPNETTLARFARRCVSMYNSTVDPKFPRMHSLILNWWDGVPHTQWVLHRDPTCETEKEPWGIEIISPLRRIYPGSVWRDEVEALWRFLHSAYFISGDSSCSTHVHISRAENFTLLELKRISQVVIHFEPGIEALMPEERRANEFARSNWIDNCCFAYRNLSRRQTIDLLEGLPTIEEVLEAMNPNESKYFGWNFLSIKRYKTIEFRRGPASSTVEDVFMWVDVVVAFVKAALSSNASSQIREYPPTVGDRLYEGKKPDDRLEPVPVGELSPEKQQKLEDKIKADRASNPVLDMMLSAEKYGA